MKKLQFYFYNNKMSRFSIKANPILKNMNRFQKNKTYGLLFPNQISANFVIDSMLNIITQPDAKELIKKRHLCWNSMLKFNSKKNLQTKNFYNIFYNQLDQAYIKEIDEKTFAELHHQGQTFWTTSSITKTEHKINNYLKRVVFQLIVWQQIFFIKKSQLKKIEKKKRRFIHIYSLIDHLKKQKAFSSKGFKINTIKKNPLRLQKPIEALWDKKSPQAALSIIVPFFTKFMKTSRVNRRIGRAVQKEIPRHSVKSRYDFWVERWKLLWIKIKKKIIASKVAKKIKKSQEESKYWYFCKRQKKILTELPSVTEKKIKQAYRFNSKKRWVDPLLKTEDLQEHGSIFFFKRHKYYDSERKKNYKNFMYKDTDAHFDIFLKKN